MPRKPNRPTEDLEVTVNVFQKCCSIPYGDRNSKQKLICRAKEISTQQNDELEVSENAKGNLVYEIPAELLQQAWDQIFGNDSSDDSNEESSSSDDSDSDSD